MRKLAIIGGFIVVVLAVAVYRAKLGAEETQGEIAGLKAQVASIGKDISVMKAEEERLTLPTPAPVDDTSPTSAPLESKEVKPQQ